MSVAATLTPQQRLDAYAFVEGSLTAQGISAASSDLLVPVVRCDAFWAGYFYIADYIKDQLEAGEKPELVGFDGFDWRKADARTMARRNELDGVPARDAVVDLVRTRLWVQESELQKARRDYDRG